MAYQIHSKLTDSFTMMNNLGSKIKIVESQVVSLFQRTGFPALLYHNLFHTFEVVFHTEEMVYHYNLDSEDSFAVITAAWFHDTGHLLNVFKGHEEAGCKIAEEHLMALGVAEPVLEKVRSCIMATRIPADPTQLIEKIICDADTYHLGTHLFVITDELVRKELELRDLKDPRDWNVYTLKFLKSHQFYTDYCRDRLSSQKEKNIALVERRIADSV